MKNPDYAKMMNEKPFLKVDNTFKLVRGQLFGFMHNDVINVAYPVWSQTADEVQFILFVREDGRPCIDNDWVRTDSNCMYTNIEPIIVEVHLMKRPTTFHSEITNFFTGKPD